MLISILRKKSLHPKTILTKETPCAKTPPIQTAVAPPRPRKISGAAPHPSIPAEPQAGLAVIRRAPAAQPHCWLRCGAASCPTLHSTMANQGGITSCFLEDDTAEQASGSLHWEPPAEASAQGAAGGAQVHHKSSASHVGFLTACIVEPCRDKQDSRLVATSCMWLPLRAGGHDPTTITQGGQTAGSGAGHRAEGMWWVRVSSMGVPIWP